VAGLVHISMGCVTCRTQATSYSGHSLFLSYSGHSFGQISNIIRPQYRTLTCSRLLLSRRTCVLHTAVCTVIGTPRAAVTNSPTTAHCIARTSHDTAQKEATIVLCGGTGCRNSRAGGVQQQLQDAALWGHLQRKGLQDTQIAKTMQQMQCSHVYNANYKLYRMVDWMTKEAHRVLEQCRGMGTSQRLCSVSNNSAFRQLRLWLYLVCVWPLVLHWEHTPLHGMTWHQHGTNQAIRLSIASMFSMVRLLQCLVHLEYCPPHLHRWPPSTR
jgi:hypothetical protein